MNVYYIGDLEFYSDPTEAIEHSGILGQKWGIRRFQYKDGSYTPEGRERYGIGQPREWDGTDEDKERILKSGSAAEVMSLQGKVSNQELQQATTRLQLRDMILVHWLTSVCSQRLSILSPMKTVRTNIFVLVVRLVQMVDLYLQSNMMNMQNSGVHSHQEIP